MKRHQDWPSRLSRFLRAAEKRPFRWGEWDCCLMAADWVRECRGGDLAADFRGQYQDALGAAMALKRYGAGDLESTATQRLGEPLPNRLLAQRGDVVSVDTPDGPALGICTGTHVAVAGQNGLIYLPLGGARMAWRV